MHIDIGHVVAISLADLFADLQRKPFEDAVGDVALDRLQVLGAPCGLDSPEGAFDPVGEPVEVKFRIGMLQLGNVLLVIAATGPEGGPGLLRLLLRLDVGTDECDDQVDADGDEKDDGVNVTAAPATSAITSSTAEPSTATTAESSPTATAESAASAGPGPGIDCPQQADDECAGGDPPVGQSRTCSVGTHRKEFTC